MLSNDASITLAVLLAMNIVENFFEIYISLRQMIVCCTTNKMPREVRKHCSRDLFEKFRWECLGYELYRIWKYILKDIIISSMIIYFGLHGYLWRRSLAITDSLHLDSTNEVIVSAFFTFLYESIDFLLKMPFEIYRVLLMERRQGYNQQTLDFFIKDRIKYFMVTNIIYTAEMCFAVYIVHQTGDVCSVYLWMLCVGTCVVFTTLYPLFTATFFDNYVPLEDGRLRDSIEQLTSALGFPLKSLYVVDSSKRSSYSNAYLYGLSNSKRIVLNDTLLGSNYSSNDWRDNNNRCTRSEILAIICHELGHWKMHHIVKQIFVSKVHFFFVCGIFSLCFKYEPLYEAVGLEPGSQPTIIAINLTLSHVLLAYNCVARIAQNLISRQFELQADTYAHHWGFTQELKKAILKLGLHFPVRDWLYSIWHESHPTLLQRIRHLNELQSKKRVPSQNIYFKKMITS